jgi:hypothetical protein
MLHTKIELDIFAFTGSVNRSGRNIGSNPWGHAFDPLNRSAIFRA